MKNLLLLLGLLLLAACSPKAERDWTTTDGFTWQSPVPEDCPFEPSQTLRGVYFTGRHSDYKAGDTFYPSWASDGNLYSSWTDGACRRLGAQRLHPQLAQPWTHAWLSDFL